MAKSLTSYSKAVNSTNDLTQKEYMDALSKNQLVTAPGDIDTPYTFKQWKQRNSGIISGREYDQYNGYLTNWYSNRYTQSDSLNDIKNDYLSLLEEIKLIFINDPDFAWLNEIDLNDNLELEEAIPIFARKLKEIAIYIINKRDAIKKAKLKYNMSGSSNALHKLFYEYLLKAFTRRNYVLNVPEQSAYNTFPDLSAVKNGFQIIIEELYDDSSYFDKDPTVPVSSYFDLTIPAVTGYFNTFNFSTTGLEWLYRTGTTQLCANDALIWTIPDNVSSLPLSSFENIDRKKLNDYNRILLAQKYLGENQYILSGGNYILWRDLFLYEFRRTNNWIYWPSGEYYQEIPDIIYDAIPLSSTSLVECGATSNIDFRLSDKIFTRTKISGADVIEGAWLKYSPYNTVNAVMSASLPNREHYHFRFPYPGYGISGDKSEWTGKEIENINSQFSTQTSSQQKQILNKYWTTMETTSTVVPISIHDTSLVDRGAKASFYYASADQISVRRNNPDLPGPGLSDDKLHDNTPSSVYKSDFEHAFLYRMEETDLPIIVGGTHINWPIFTYEEDEPIPLVIPSSQCIDISLASINIEQIMVGATAGRNLYNSDIIYKLNGKDGRPIEAAFLIGPQLSSLAVIDVPQVQGAPPYLCGGIYAGRTNTICPTSVHGAIQPSLSFKCTPGKQVKFIWEASEDLDLNSSTIVHKDHQVDCPYLRSEHKSIIKNIHSFTTETGVSNWKDCRCKAIMYSPIGHHGNTFDEYRRNADIICVDTQWPEPFEIQSWRGRDNKPYTTSSDFAWFQLTGAPMQGSVSATEPDVGWGAGAWKTGDGSSFTLEQGIQYCYLRSTLEQSTVDIDDEIVPPLIIKQPRSYSACRWMKAKLQGDGTWSEGDYEVTSMVLRPGDYLYYDHVDTRWYCLSDGVKGICQDTINFLINQPLQGWDYNTHSFTGAGQGGRPWWAQAVDDDSWTTKHKGVIQYGGGIRSDIIDNYTLIVQPDVSTITLSSDDTVDYYNNTGSTLIWNQPLTFHVSGIREEWCNLEINYQKLSPLNPNLFYIDHEMVSRATDDLSTMLLQQRQDGEVTLVNYWAQNPFTWSQYLTYSTVGFPPTGGRWIPPTSGLLIDALVPYANLTNRHYPTIASMPYVGNLYTTEDKGGYFVPRLLGAGVYLGKNYSNVFDTTRIPNNTIDRQLSAVFQDPNIYTSDAGLTNRTQTVPLSTDSIDASWMKADVTAGLWSGSIINAKENQNFTPYQTKYETINTNPNGIITQDVEYDPWTGEFDNTWADDINYPSNFRGEYPIQEWYRDLPAINKKIYNWTTDIFGNNYALFKDSSINSMYDLSIADGDVWVRNAANKITSGVDALSGIYDSFITPAALYSQLTNNNVKSIDVWFDTIMFETSAYIAIQKIFFDYDTSRIYGIADSSRYIDLSSSNGSKFAGTWFFEEEKQVMFCNAILENSIVYPYLREYSLDSGEMKLVYNGITDNNIIGISSIGYTEIEKPVFNYNYLTKTYNMTFIGYTSANPDKMTLTTINIGKTNTGYESNSIINVTPAGVI